MSAVCYAEELSTYALYEQCTAGGETKAQAAALSFFTGFIAGVSEHLETQCQLLKLGVPKEMVSAAIEPAIRIKKSAVCSFFGCAKPSRLDRSGKKRNRYSHAAGFPVRIWTAPVLKETCLS